MYSNNKLQFLINVSHTFYYFKKLNLFTIKIEYCIFEHISIILSLSKIFKTPRSGSSAMK